MDLQTIVRNIKLTVAEDRDKAFSDLLNFLSLDPKYRKLENAVRALQSKDRDLQRRKRLDIIRSQDYNVEFNKVTTDLLTSLDDLANGLTEPSTEYGKEIKMPDMKRLAGMLGICILVGCGILAGAGYLIAGLFTEDIECPEFRPDCELKVMLLPFDKLGGEESAPHIAIKQRLENFDQTVAERTSFKIFDDYARTSMIADEDIARVQGEGCGADMVVWGNYENNAENYFVNADFTFTSPAFVEEEISSADGVDYLTFNSLTDITDGSELTADLEAQLVLILGIVVMYKQGLHVEVLQYLEEHRAELSDPKIRAVAKQISALCNLNLGNEPQAAADMREAMRAFPNNWLAAANQGIWHYKKQRYGKALESFNLVLSQDPKNVNILIRRGQTYEKLKQFDLAKKDLNKAKEENTSAKKEALINTRIIEIDKAIVNSNTNITRLSRGPSGSSANSSTLTQRASENLSIGNTEQAKFDARTALEKDPTNAEAARLYLEATSIETDNIGTMKASAEQANLSEQQIKDAYRASPLLRSKIKQEDIRRITRNQ